MRMMGLLASGGGAGTPPPDLGVTYYARETLNNLAANDTNIAGRVLDDLGGAWSNWATNTMNAVFTTPNDIRGAANATAIYIAGTVAGQASQAVKARFLFTSYTTSSCGVVAQADPASASRYDCLVLPEAPHKLVIQRNTPAGTVQIAESVDGAATYWPINTVKTLDLRIIDNEDGTYDLEAYVDDVLICSGTDSDPLETLGRAGIRGRNSARFYFFEHRSLVTSGGGGVVDTTPPVLTSPTDSANGMSAANGGVTTDEGNGTLYWVVTGSATAPSGAQVKAGQNHLGAAAAASGSQAVSSAGAKTISPSGLSAGQTYYTHFIHTDAADNDSSVVSADGFTTSATLGVRGVARVAGPAGNGTTITPTMPAHAAGDTLIAITGSDGTPTLSTPGWTNIGVQNAAGSQARLMLFRKDTVAASSSEPAPTFTSTASEQFCAGIYALSGPSLLNVQFAGAQGADNAANPANLVITDGPKDCILIAAAVLDGGVGVSAAPTDYGDFERVTNGTSDGCVLATAHRIASNVSAENPSAFANTSEQWAAATVAAWV